MTYFNFRDVKAPKIYTAPEFGGGPPKDTNLDVFAVDSTGQVSRKTIPSGKHAKKKNYGKSLFLMGKSTN